MILGWEHLEAKTKIKIITHTLSQIVGYGKELNHIQSQKHRLLKKTILNILKNYLGVIKMMNFTKFDKYISTILYFGNIQYSKTMTEHLYNLMKNDFTDYEMKIICEDICKHEDLFGKYPPPKMFYDRKPKDKSNMVMIVEGQFYLDDTMPEYKEYLIGVSDEEQERIWKWIFNNKYGQEVSKDWIIERIIQFRKPKEVKCISDEKFNLSGLIKKIEE